MSNKKIGIGIVHVQHGMPDQGNPFRAPRGAGLIGEERIAALTAFKKGGPVGDLTFWSLERGNVRELADQSEIDWSTSRIP